MKQQQTLAVKAVRMKQAGIPVYMFALPGAQIFEIAEISRIRRDVTGELEGYQRGEIRGHIVEIATYLAGGDVLFPNPLILALPPGAHFQRARGPGVRNALPGPEIGTLHLPIGDTARLGWIVDGQQRALALSRRPGCTLTIPVVAFVSADVALHREQFVLVNKARPLPRAVVDVLLPSMDAALLPRDLGPRRTPSILVDALDTHRDSPFAGLIRRPGSENPDAVVNDQALIRAIKRSIGSPLGALAPYAHRNGEPDIGMMYTILSGFWGAAREIFPEAWGLPPTQSRLMHTAGIEAMSYLMDRILARPEAATRPRQVALEALARIAPHCRWTTGRWDALGLAWDEIEVTGRTVSRLRDHLIRLEHSPRIAA